MSVIWVYMFSVISEEICPMIVCKFNTIHQGIEAHGFRIIFIRSNKRYKFVCNN